MGCVCLRPGCEIGVKLEQITAGRIAIRSSRKQGLLTPKLHVTGLLKTHTISTASIPGSFPAVFASTKKRLFDSDSRF